MSPPCICASPRAIESPMPRPPQAWSAPVSAWVNISNTRGNWSAAIPIPVSATHTTASTSAKVPERRAARQSGSRLKVRCPTRQYQRGIRVPGGVTRR